MNKILQKKKHYELLGKVDKLDGYIDSILAQFRTKDYLINLKNMHREISQKEWMLMYNDIFQISCSEKKDEELYILMVILSLRNGVTFPDRSRQLTTNIYRLFRRLGRYYIPSNMGRVIPFNSDIIPEIIVKDVDFFVDYIESILSTL